MNLNLLKLLQDFLDNLTILNFWSAKNTSLHGSLRGHAHPFTDKHTCVFLQTREIRPTHKNRHRSTHLNTGCSPPMQRWNPHSSSHTVSGLLGCLMAPHPSLAPSPLFFLFTIFIIRSILSILLCFSVCPSPTTSEYLANRLLHPSSSRLPLFTLYSSYSPSPTYSSVGWCSTWCRWDEWGEREGVRLCRTHSHIANIDVPTDSHTLSITC